MNGLNELHAGVWEAIGGTMLDSNLDFNPGWPL